MVQFYINIPPIERVTDPFEIGGVIKGHYVTLLGLLDIFIHFLMGNFYYRIHLVRLIIIPLLQQLCSELCQFMEKWKTISDLLL